MSASDLTPQEQTHVRAALRFLRARCGTWATVAKALRIGEGGISNISRGHRTVTPTMAFRVARLAKVGVDDVLAGRFPEAGTCPLCGQMTERSS